MPARYIMLDGEHRVYVVAKRPLVGRKVRDNRVVRGIGDVKRERRRCHCLPPPAHRSALSNVAVPNVLLPHLAHFALLLLVLLSTSALWGGRRRLVSKTQFTVA